MVTNPDADGMKRLRENGRYNKSAWHCGSYREGITTEAQRRM